MLLAMDAGLGGFAEELVGSGFDGIEPASAEIHMLAQKSNITPSDNPSPKTSATEADGDRDNPGWELLTSGCDGIH